MILLPFPHFMLSAHILETKRLAETNQAIMEILLEQRPETERKTVYIMWKNYTDPLADYGNIIAKEMIVRGFPLKEPFPYTVSKVPYCLPPFFGKDSYHEAHRKFLMQMNPAYYRKFFKRS